MIEVTFAYAPIPWRKVLPPEYERHTTVRIMNYTNAKHTFRTSRLYVRCVFFLFISHGMRPRESHSQAFAVAVATFCCFAAAI